MGGQGESEKKAENLYIFMDTSQGSNMNKKNETVILNYLIHCTSLPCL